MHPRIRSFLSGLLLTVFALPLAAQDAAPPDTIVLKNGDRLAGKVVGLADGKLTFESPVLGKLTVALADLTAIETAAPVTIRDPERKEMQRRIAGIETGNLVLLDADGRRTAVPFAQVDAINPPPVAWTGSVAFSGMLQDGNTEKRTAALSADASRRTDQDRISLRANWNYDEERTAGDWNLIQRRLSGSGKYDWFLDAKSYLFANVGAAYDTKADLDLRFIAGVGYGRQWLDQDTLSFATDIGISWVSEDYATPGVATEEYAALQLSWDFKWQIAESLRFLQNTAVFPSLEDSDDVYAKADSRLRWTMGDSMFSQLQWVWDYDNTPAPGKERSDHMVVLGIGWDF
jgi:putative salt-induced outer membrane protein YdiY